MIRIILSMFIVAVVIVVMVITFVRDSDDWSRWP